MRVSANPVGEGVWSSNFYFIEVKTVHGGVFARGAMHYRCA